MNAETATQPPRPANAPVNMAPTPKNRFRMSGTRISDHRKLIENPAFEGSVDYAMAEYQMILAMDTSHNPSQAAYNGLKACGAQEFLDVLKRLSEQPIMPRVVQPANLNHQV